MKIKVLGRYTNTARNIDVYPGDEIEVKDELGYWLANDAPGCFEIPGQAQPAADQKPFDLPPDGTTLATDTTPPVITGSESGVEVVHRADEDEQQDVLDEQKALDAPPADTMVHSAKTKAK